MKEIINKIQNGDFLSDAELTIAINHYARLVTLLNDHGELYRLTWRHAFDTLQNLTSYHTARLNK